MAKFRFLFPFQGPVKSIWKSSWQLQEPPSLLPCQHIKGEMPTFSQKSHLHACGLFMESHKHFNIPNYGLQQAQLTIPNSTPCRHRLPWYYKAAIEVAPPSMPHTIFTDPLDTRLGVVTG